MDTKPATSTNSTGIRLSLQDLIDRGVLWAINRTMFHPAGFALAVVLEDGEITGFELLGAGSEVWHFADPALENVKLAAVQDLFREAREAWERPTWRLTDIVEAP